MQKENYLLWSWKHDTSFFCDFYLQNADIPCLMQKRPHFQDILSCNLTGKDGLMQNIIILSGYAVLLFCNHMHTILHHRVV